ncbi:MAG: alpha/beta fold hydrolase, partial [Sciscionella sp.]|nr:alpha/beta fold hydrolase [Sciscionella sp.]
CGYRVITLDLLGHGESDRPTQYWRYSTTAWAEQVIALLDHLDVRTAVVGGTSLGANVGLQVAAIAPERLHGIVAELPVLDNTAIAGAIAFTPLLLAARFTPWLVDATAWVANRVPRGSHWIDMLTETLRQRPRAMTATMLGVLFGPVAPPKSVRRRITLPALVLGRRHDPVHPFGDAGTLAVELPNAQFVEAGNPFELRVRPERLTEVIIEFLGRTFAAGANRSPVDRGNP